MKSRARQAVRGSQPTCAPRRSAQAERDKLNQLKNPYDQLKQRNDSLSIQGLQPLQPKFQAFAGDGGPQSRGAQGYADSIPGAIAAVQARAGKKSPANKNTGKCEALVERAQLGDTLSAEERAYLKDQCH
jgi:hypothetical protein